MTGDEIRETLAKIAGIFLMGLSAFITVMLVFSILPIEF